MKKPKRNRQSQPTPTNPRNSREQLDAIVKNENTIMKILKWFFKWQTLVGIATIVSAIIAIWMILPKKTKEEKLMEKIDGNVEQILQTFKPEDINTNFPLIEARKLVSDFQHSVIDYVIAWKDVVAIKDLSEFGDNNPEELSKIMMSQLSVVDIYVKRLSPIYTRINDALIYGKENNIAEFIPNLAHFQNIINKVELRNKSGVQSAKRIMNLMNEVSKKYPSKDKKTIPKKELQKVSKSFQEFYMNKDQLTFMHELTSYLILLNTSYMSYLNRPTY